MYAVFIDVRHLISADICSYWSGFELAGTQDTRALAIALAIDVNSVIYFYLYVHYLK